ncbi:MAG: DUF6029 family protein [Ignavibacteriaceae bacterium]
MKLFISGVFVFLFIGNILGQEFQLPEGLSFSNQMKYSYDISKKLEITEDWFNLDYRNGIFSAGFRFDTFQPNDPSSAVNRGKKRFTDFGFKYIKAEIGDKFSGGEFTVGNYYALFGRGLTLKSFEDRNIRIDNNLLGIKFSGRYKDFVVTALSGMPENFNLTRTDILHAVDLEYRGLRFLKIGVSLLSNQPENEQIVRTSLASVRLQPSFYNFNLYTEFAVKQNNDIKENVFNGNEFIAGKGFYSNLSFYYGNFSMLGEYKIYDNFAFTTSDGTVTYNTPPATRRDYTYSLLNKHPSALDANNEEGGQIELNYNFWDFTFLTASFSLTKTLPVSSYYQRIQKTKNEPLTQLKEFYTQLNHQLTNSLYTTFALGYSEELTSATKNLTSIVDLRYSVDEMNTIRLIYEHQQTNVSITNEDYYNQALTFELLHSPDIVLGFNGTMETKEPTQGRKVRRTWKFVQLSYKIGEHSDLILLYGSRQAGNICIGGVCRYEPEFNGIELKMFTRF